MKTKKCDAVEIFDALSESHLFSGLSKEELSGFSRIVSVRSYAAGGEIFAEGDHADGFYIVMSGKVKIYKISASGKTQIIHIFGPGEPFGEAAVFMENTFPAYAGSVSGSDLLFIRFDDFMRYMQKEPRLALNIIASLCVRLKGFLKTIEDLSLGEVASRLAGYIVKLAEESCDDPGDGTLVTLGIKKGILASQLGTIPETLSRTLAKLKKGGVIRTEGRNITVLDYEKLCDIAGGAA